MTRHRRSYSRLARVEAKKAKRATFVYVALTLLLIFIVVFFGFGLASRFANIINKSASSDTPIQISDNTPPAPPKLDSLPEYTNKTKLSLSGNAEAGSSVVVFFNNSSEELIADASGNFSFTLSLQKGKNTISATATDQAGNKSQRSSAIQVFYDNEPPTLDIASPQNNASVSDSQITINGTTEPDADVTVNDRVLITNSDGSFTGSLGLNEGENTLTFIATDQAGNETETSFTVSYQP